VPLASLAHNYAQRIGARKKSPLESAIPFGYVLGSYLSAIETKKGVIMSDWELMPVTDRGKAQLDWVPEWMRIDQATGTFPPLSSIPVRDFDDDDDDDDDDE